MKKFQLIIIGFFLILLSTFSYSTESEYNACTCPNPWVEVDTVVIDEPWGWAKTPPEVPAPAYSCFPNVSKQRNTLIYIEGTYDSFYKNYLYNKRITIDKKICSSCSEEDTSFPAQDINYTYSPSWSADSAQSDDNTASCLALDGSTETAKTDCLDYLRCKIPIVSPDNNDTDCDKEGYESDSDGECTDNCKEKYAKDVAGICSSDRDNDGVPDKEDDYPDDSSKSSDNEDGGSCVDTCGTDIGICTTEYSISSSNTPIAHVVYIACDTCERASRDFYGLTCDEWQGFGNDKDHDCLNGQVPGPNYDNDPSDCILLENCDYPPKLIGFTFQSLTYTGAECINLINKYGDANGRKFELPNCSSGNYACYYNVGNGLPDGNNTLSDSNSTIPDSNTSDDFDDGAIVSKLEDIKNINKRSRDFLEEIQRSTLIQTSTLSEKLDTLATVTSNTNNEIKEAVKGNTKTLGSKLDGIKKAINDKGVTPATDMTEANSRLKSIDEALNYEGTDTEEGEEMNASIILGYDNSAVDTFFTNSNTAIGNIIKSTLDEYLIKLKTLSTVSVPQGSCGCTDPTVDFTVFGKHYSHKMSICYSYKTVLEMLKPVLWFLAFILLLFHFYRTF